jgi:hypothetical protein
MEFASIPDWEPEKKLSFIVDNQQGIFQFLREDEANLMFGFFIDRISDSKNRGSYLRRFKEGFNSLSGYQEVKNKLEGIIWNLIQERWGKLYPKKESKVWVSSLRDLDDIRSTEELRSLAGASEEKFKRILDLLLSDDFEERLSGRTFKRDQN